MWVITFYIHLIINLLKFKEYVDDAKNQKIRVKKDQITPMRIFP